MATATLTKWGNSQGVVIPKSACEHLGVSVGDRLEIEPADNGTLIIKPRIARHQRAKKVTIEELFEGYEGGYDPPNDWPAVGAEVDWGASVGKEAW